MKRVLAVLILTASFFPAASADPLKEAHSGKLQCYRPDTARKTCLALSGYATQSDGTILNNADALFAVQPPLVMRTTSVVAVKGEAVCGSMRQADIEHAEFLADGKKVPESQAAAIRAQIIPMLRSQFGKEVCATYAPSGKKMSATVTIDGVANPALTQEFVWVKPEEGYKVSP